MLMKKNESGFSLFELMIVIAIVAILSVIAIPNFLSWRDNANLRGSAFNLKSDFELAKMRAIRGGGNVAIAFNGNRCEVFLDTDGDYTRDTTPSPGETLITSRVLDNITVNANFGGSPQTAFNNRGIVLRTGNVRLTQKGTTIQIGLNRIGLVEIQ